MTYNNYNIYMTYNNYNNYNKHNHNQNHYSYTTTTLHFTALQLHCAASSHFSIHRWVRSAIHSIRRNQPLLNVSYLETSTTALCGTYWYSNVCHCINIDQLLQWYLVMHLTQSFQVNQLIQMKCVCVSENGYTKCIQVLKNSWIEKSMKVRKPWGFGDIPWNVQTVCYISSNIVIDLIMSTWSPLHDRFISLAWMMKLIQLNVTSVLTSSTCWLGSWASPNG